MPDKGRNIKDIHWKIKHFMVIFMIKLRSHIFRYTIPHPETIYWISPDRIVYHTNYNKSGKNIPFRNRVFNSVKDKGKIIRGNWDISDYKFTDLYIYKALEARIKYKKKWESTDFYKRILNEIRLEKTIWGCKNQNDLNKRCKYIDSIYKSIKEKGYQLSSNIQIENDKSLAAKNEEVMVNIGRDGNYLFENGRHRLAIAKILNIPKIPVKVVVRHKEWQEFRDFLLSYAKNTGGKLYQPIIHPDLSGIPCYHACEDRFEAIKKNLRINKDKMLDIGANFGYFCHKFEDLGYECYAVEKAYEPFYIMSKLKIAENKKFKTINNDILQVKLIKTMKFDVVLALNIFHHFLKTKETYEALKKLLKNIKTDAMFFEPHLYNEPQMRDAYINYPPEEFVKFILKHSCLNKSKLIHTASDGRKVYKLYNEK